jgi:hypothetical protein
MFDAATAKCHDTTDRACSYSERPGFKSCPQKQLCIISRLLSLSPASPAHYLKSLSPASPALYLKYLSPASPAHYLKYEYLSPASPAHYLKSRTAVSCQHPSQLITQRIESATESIVKLATGPANIRSSRRPVSWASSIQFTHSQTSS